MSFGLKNLILSKINIEINSNNSNLMYYLSIFINCSIKIYWKEQIYFLKFCPRYKLNIFVYYSQPEVCTWHLLWVGWSPGTWRFEDTRGSSSPASSDNLVLHLLSSGFWGSDSSILVVLCSFPLHFTRVVNMSVGDLAVLVSSIEAIPESR